MDPHKPENNLFFFFDMLSFIVGIFCFMFGLYVMPHVLFGLVYQVPDFVVEFNYFIAERYQLTGYALKATALLPYFILTVFFLGISSRITKALERKELHIGEGASDVVEVNDVTSKSIFRLFMELVVLIVFVALAIYAGDYLLQ